MEKNSYPEKCPVTGRPFFAELENEDGELVPTYGNAHDSYTIPTECEDDDEKSWVCNRFCHDRGAWVGEECYSFDK